MPRSNMDEAFSVNRMLDRQLLPTPRKRFRFGRFELDVHARELRKDGVRFRLQDQPFLVLESLLQRPGEVFTREELCRQLWPDGTYVDFEHGLNAAIKRLRSALGDSAEAPRFVETLHRRGYRFIAPLVHDVDDRVMPSGTGTSETAAARIVEEPARDAMDRKLRLAVLPFADLSGDEGVSYFSEGLTDEMITQFGRVCASRLAVVAQSSSMLAPREASARDIGRSLRADYLVEGGVRRDGNRVRISVRLVEAETETQVWANAYDRDVSDCFTVQAEVAAEAVRSLTTELLPDSCSERAGTRYAPAYQAYLIGRYHWNRTADTGLADAAVHFERALRLDPLFAAAHAALGRTAAAAASYYARDPRTALEEARQAATRALALDPTESEAHVTMAQVRTYVDRDRKGAEAAFRDALMFNPNCVAVHRLYALFLAACGRCEEAQLAARRACDLDPLCLGVNTSAAWVEYLAGNYADAIERCQHTLDMDGSFLTARRQLAAALLAQANVDEAIAEIENDPPSLADPTSVAWLAHALGVGGYTERAVALLEQLEGMSTARHVSAYHRALAHTGVGDAERALDALAAADIAHDPALIDLEVEPRFAPIRAERRFRDLVARMSLVGD